MGDKASTLSLFIKHRMCGTPLEKPLDAFRSMRRWRRLAKHPGLAEIASEQVAIDQFIEHTIKSDWNCVDVGAHIGSFTSRIVNLAPSGNHFAFEAIPYKAGWIAKRWKNVSVISCAVGDVSAEVTFYENQTRPGFSSLGVRDSSDATPDKIKEIRVQMTTLDDALPKAIRVNFIKIDVEGAEISVLRGGSNIISQHMPLILFESGPGGAESCGYDRLDLYDLLEHFGYDIFLPRHALYKREPLTRGEFDLSHKYPFRAFNYFAIPSKHDRALEQANPQKQGKQ